MGPRNNIIGPFLGPFGNAPPLLKMPQGCQQKKGNQIQALQNFQLLKVQETKALTESACSRFMTTLLEVHGTIL